MKSANLIRLAILGLLLTLSLFINQANAEPATDIFISEYIEGSSNNKALEFYNGTGAPINLDSGNYSVEYYNNGATSATVTIDLTGIVANSDVFVLTHSSADASILNKADQTNGDGWYNGNDAVVLKHNGTIIDSMGQIGNSSTWGENQTLLRKTAVCTGDTITTDSYDPSIEWDGFAQNNSDNLGSHTATCSGGTAPYVTSTTPSNNATQVGIDATVTVTFSEDVTFDGNTIAYSCDDASGDFTVTPTGGPTVWTITPLSDFANAETCTVTIDTDDVTDIDDPLENMSHPYTFSFTTENPEGIIYIHDVQGAGSSVAIPGEVTVEGVVVAEFQDSDKLSAFFLQEEDSDTDGNPATSEGIMVFCDSCTTAVSIGQIVSVTGIAEEYYENSQIDVAAGSVNITDAGDNSGLVTAAQLSLPVSAVADLEAFEGMLTTFAQELTVTEHYNLGRYGNVLLSAGGRLMNPTQIADPGAPATAVAEANTRHQIMIDDANETQNPDPIVYPAPGLSASNTLRTGNTINDLTGVLMYGHDSYRIQPTISPNFVDTNVRTNAPMNVGGDITVASFNVLNYFTTYGMRGAENATEFARQHDKIINALVSIDADVVGLIEIENNATEAVESLVTGLNSILGAGTYDYIDTGRIGTDEIKLAFIYKPASVIPFGTYAILDSSVDPDFLDTKNRPALAQTFENAEGERFTVTVNHLKSKGSSCASIGDPDLGDGQGNCNVTRTDAAAAIADWLETDPTGSNDDDFIIMGDLNAYAKEDPITILEADGYTNLHTAFAQEAYSYVFNGAFGTLDYMMANATMTAQISGATAWHINSDEPRSLDYNTNFKSAGQITSLYAPDAYRSSDHDPIIVGIDFDQSVISSPTVTNISPDSSQLNVETAVTITGTDFRPGITAALVKDSNTYMLTNVVLSTNIEITAVVPNTVPPGTYDLVVTNVDTQTATLPSTFTVEDWSIYLPLIIK